MVNYSSLLGKFSILLLIQYICLFIRVYINRLTSKTPLNRRKAAIVISIMRKHLSPVSDVVLGGSGGGGSGCGDKGSGNPAHDSGLCFFHCRLNVSYKRSSVSIPFLCYGLISTKYH